MIYYCPSLFVHYYYYFFFFHAQYLHVFGIFFSFYVGCLVRITFLRIVICLPTVGVLSSLHCDFAISLKASCPDMSKLKNITVTSGNMKSVHQEILVWFFTLTTVCHIVLSEIYFYVFPPTRCARTDHRSI